MHTFRGLAFRWSSLLTRLPGKGIKLTKHHRPEALPQKVLLSNVLYDVSKHLDVCRKQARYIREHVTRSKYADWLPAVN